ncbi:MAG: CarD family transcriptional regulator, partial [Acutalibacteraceae bacterium]
MFFDKALKSLPEFAAAERDVKSDTLPAAISGLSHFHKIHIAGALAEETAKKALYLTGDEAEAARAAEDLNALGIGAVYLPSRDLNLSRAGAVSHEYEHQRLYALCSVLSGKAQVLTCSAQSASQYIPSPRTLEASSFMLKKGDTVSMTGLCERLVGAGYTRTGLVEGAGQFACRGGLLDIFPSDSVNPFRVDFFGDEIDGIYVFDPESQRRGSDAGEIFIAPARELIFDPGELADRIEGYLTENGELSDETRKNLVCDADILKSTNTLPWADCYLPLLKDALSTVFDYADGLIFVSEWNKIKAALDSGRENLMLETEALLACGSVLPDFDGYILPEKEIIKSFKRAVYMDGLLYSRYDVPPRDIITMSLRSVSPWSGTVSALADDLKAPLSSGYCAVLAVGTMKAARAIEKDLPAFGISGFACEPFDRLEPGKLLLVPIHISQGGEYPGSKFMLVPFKTAVGTKKRSRYKKGNAIGGLDELKRGDAVVHSVHGIGIFDGVHKIESQGVIKDYIKIKYRGSDVLYLPVTQLDLVSKYIGPSGDDAKIKLS